MKYNLLGKTGLKVSELCMGTMTFGGKGYFKPIGTLGQEPIDALMKRAIDGGINFIDTANVYSEGLSEELTGKSIRNLGLHRDELVLATKVRGRMGDGPNDEGLGRIHIRQAVQQGAARRIDKAAVVAHRIGADAEPRMALFCFGHRHVFAARDVELVGEQYAHAGGHREGRRLERRA